MLPLSGIRVLDFTRMLPGPYCTAILGDLGADIIRVVAPNDPYAEPPPYYSEGHISAFNTLLMRNKKSILLNLKSELSEEIVRRLVEHCDIIVENFRPGVADRLGIGYEKLSEINPSIIYCSITGFGPVGKYRNRAGHDLNYTAMAGLLSLNRFIIPGKRDGACLPSVPMVRTADIAGAFYAVISILAAVIARSSDPNHRGMKIDIPITACAITLNPMEAAKIFCGNGPNLLQGDYPFYTVYKTSDEKFLAVATIEIKFWNRFLELLGLDSSECPQFGPPEVRRSVYRKIAEVIGKKSADEWNEIFTDENLPVSIVAEFGDALEDGDLCGNAVRYINHPRLGKIRCIGFPALFSSFNTPLKPSYGPGENTAEILTELGFTEEDVRKFEKAGCIGRKNRC